ncbi:hypothetical protein RFI_30315, partial [Reticulomyxa filosa]
MYDPFFTSKKPKDNPASVLPKSGDAKVSNVLYGIKPNIFFKKKQNLVDLMNEQRIIACFQNDPKWKNDPNPLENPKYWQLFFALNLKFKLNLAVLLILLDLPWTLGKIGSTFDNILFKTIKLKSFHFFKLGLKAFIFKLTKLELLAVENRIKTGKKKKKEKSEENNSDIVESQLPLQTAGTIFHFYLLCSIVRTGLVAFHIGHLFQLADTLLVDSVLFLSYLWYQFEYLKYRVIAITASANILFFCKIAADSDNAAWKDILYSCIIFNCGILSMANSLYLASKEQLLTVVDDLSNRTQLHEERKEHASIMNSLMPAPVTEQILLKGDVPIYRKDVTIGFVYFTFYNKSTMQKIKDNSTCVEILHYL